MYGTLIKRYADDDYVLPHVARKVLFNIADLTLRKYARDPGMKAKGFPQPAIMAGRWKFKFGELRQYRERVESGASFK